MVKVFTYGTLMRGFWNHHVMERAEGKFVGEAFIRGKDIFFVSPNSFPVVIDGAGIVFGEVFEVHESKLKHLDRLEGYHKDRPSDSMYLRKRALARMRNGEQIWVSYYYWNRDIKPELKIFSGRYPRRN